MDNHQDQSPVNIIHHSETPPGSPALPKKSKSKLVTLLAVCGAILPMFIGGGTALL